MVCRVGDRGIVTATKLMAMRVLAIWTAAIDMIALKVVAEAITRT